MLNRLLKSTALRRSHQLFWTIVALGHVALLVTRLDALALESTLRLVIAIGFSVSWALNPGLLGRMPRWLSILTLALLLGAHAVGLLAVICAVLLIPMGVCHKLPTFRLEWPEVMDPGFVVPQPRRIPITLIPTPESVFVRDSLAGRAPPARA